MGAFTFVADRGIAHKMKLTRIATVMIFTILSALPSKISDAEAPVNCSAQRLQVAILLVPPLTLKTSYNDVKTDVSSQMNKVKGGILGDLITRIIGTCINCPPCNDHVAATKSKCFQVTNFEDEQDVPGIHSQEKFMYRYRVPHLLENEKGIVR